MEKLEKYMHMRIHASTGNMHINMHMRKSDTYAIQHIFLQHCCLLGTIDQTP